MTSLLQMVVTRVPLASIFKRTIAQMILAVGVYATIRYIFIRQYRVYQGLPPGLIGFPLFGSFVGVATKGHRFYIDIARRYPSICTVPLGTLTTVCINDEKILRQVLSNDCARYRPDVLDGLFKSPDASLPQNLLGLPGHAHEWKQRRKFFASNLMTLLNKHFVDKHVKTLIEQVLVPVLDDYSNDTKRLWFCHTDMQHLNFCVMYHCIYGTYLERNDPSFLRYLDLFTGLDLNAQKSFLLNLLLGVRVSIFIRTNLTDGLSDYYRKMLDLTQEWAKRAHQNYDPDNLQTYFDYTYHALSQDKPNAAYDEIITSKVLADFDVAIQGGTDTAAATLEFCIAIASKYPSIQDEIYHEILQVVGDIKTNFAAFNPLDHLFELHKLRAFLEECLRMIPVFPTGVFRQIRNKGGLKVNADGKEYILPDNCVISPNIVGMQMSPQAWRTPEEFDISRWLNQEGKFDRKSSPKLMNFTFGSRECPGRVLALKSMYLVVAILFSKYRFYQDEPEKLQVEMKQKFLLHVHPKVGCKVMKR